MRNAAARRHAYSYLRRAVRQMPSPSFMVVIPTAAKRSGGPAFACSEKKSSAEADSLPEAYVANAGLKANSTRGAHFCSELVLHRAGNRNFSIGATRAAHAASLCSASGTSM